MESKEVCLKYHVSNYTLHYYEKEGLIGPIKKNKSDHRIYEDKDLKRLEFILCMRKAKISIKTLKEYIFLYEQGDKTKNERLKLLKKELKNLEEKISNMQEAKKYLTHKIELYEQDKLEELLKEKA